MLTFRQRHLRRQIELKLYPIRRIYGAEAVLYLRSEGTDDFDPITGEPNETVTTQTPLKDFICWSPIAKKRFEYDLSFVAANKNFTYGGIFETGDLICFVLYTDVGDDFVWSDRNYIVHEGQEYRAFKFEKLQHNVGYIIHLRYTQANKNPRVYSRTVEHTIVVEQTVATS